MEKMQKTARILDRVIQVIFWILVVSVAIIACASIAVLFAGEEMLSSEATQDIILSINGISLSGEGISIPNAPKTIPVLALLAAAFCALWLYGLQIIRAILAPMKEGKPFVAAVSKSLRRLGWLSLAFGAAQFVLMTIAQSMMAGLLSEAIRDTGLKLSVQYSYDIGFILVAAVLFLFSYIFRYGEELQRLSDETL